MTWWQFLLWGAFGGMAVEAVEFYGAIRRTGDWPWQQPGEPRLGPLLVSVVIRVGLGAGLAAAASHSQVSGPLGAIAIGVSAPLLIEQMGRQVPVAGAHLPEALQAPDVSPEFEIERDMDAH